MAPTATKTARTSLRQVDLNNAFVVPLMLKVWRETVRDGLRSQGVQDLHDYLDFHRNREAIFKNIREEIGASAYRPRRSQLIRLEKSRGICRRIHIPAPEDAVILQTLVENLSQQVLKKQPSTNSFYSRTHAHPGQFSEIDGTFPYSRSELWVEFRKRVMKFSSAGEYTIVTDITNYFDSLPLGQLRNTLASMGEFAESLLDFLFFMLEEFVWRPDYLPLSGIGLPQLNFDAPRLLAHCYLFEADSYLAQRVNGNFVRWMDDMNIGAGSEHEARRILRDLDDMLHTRGIRLNAGKTRILDSDCASQHFAVVENQELTLLDNLIKNRRAMGKDVADLSARLRKMYSKWSRRKTGSWDKILKRFFTLFGKLSDAYLSKAVPTLLRDEPDIRESVFRYYAKIGYSPVRFDQIISYILCDCMDDVSQFQACRLLTEWIVPRGKRVAIVDLAFRIAKSHEPIAVASALWLLAKYGQIHELRGILHGEVDVWRSTPFVARQVAALSPRLWDDRDLGDWVRDRLRHYGQFDAIRVLDNIQDLQAMSGVLDRSLASYLMPSKRSDVYPLPKVLIAKAVLTSSLAPTELSRLRRELECNVTDPYYKTLLTL